MDGGSSMKTSASGLNELTELQSLQTRYVDVIQALRTDIGKRVTEYNDLKTQFDRLKTDFLYNLQLLRERDADLAANEKVFHEHNIKICQKDKEISDLKVKIDELMISVGNEAKAREQLQLHYQQRIREKQAELEQYRSAKDAEVTQERNDLELLRRNLERQVKELEEELEIQRRELTRDYDEAAKKREHEFRIQRDQMSNTVLSHELKVKLLTKELELARAARESSGQEVKHVENAQRDLEKRLKRKEWELEEMKALKDARISDLEEKLCQSEQSLKRQEEDFIRKYAELNQMLKRKDLEFTKASETSANREHQLLGEVRILTEKLDESSVKLRQLEWNLDDATKERDNITEKLEAEIADIKTRWERHVTEISRDSVGRDVHLNALREAEEGLKDELVHRKQDIERYKKDLAESLERESAAERARAQAELDWQRRCEDLERLSYQRSEDLVRNLTKAKDEAVATVEQQKLEMEQMEQLMHLLRQERDQALAVLARNGLKADRQMEVLVRDESSSSDVTNLRQQNQKLQAVIRQMKEDMEKLTKTLPERLSSSDYSHDNNNEYVKSLEGELSALKSKYRQLELKFYDLEVTNSGVAGQHTSDTADRTLVHSNASVNAHLEQLNGTIMTLRKEKVELTAQLRKLQTTAIHLQGRIDQLSKQPIEKQAQIDQLQYEVNASKRRFETEAMSLRQRIADLELQVTEARKEADEYYRASMESNAEVNALSNQVSQLKLELATANPAINFGAQELVIQQLEDVIVRQASGVDGISQVTSGGDQESVGVYKARLKMAVKDLIKIAQKNKLLTEINNRLLAEMSKNGMRPSSLAKHPAVVSGGKVHVPLVPSTEEHQKASSNLTKLMQNKLQQLEELQYHITKQELAMKGQVRGQEVDEDFQPQSILKNSSTRRDASPRPHKLQAQPGNSPKGSSPRVFGNSPKGVSSSQELRKSLVSESSLGGESLQEIWQLIDEDRSPTPRTGKREEEGGPGSPSNPRPRPGSTDSWMVTGLQPRIVQRQNNTTSKRKVLSAKAAGKARPLQRIRPIVTNYNKLHGSRESVR